MKLKVIWDIRWQNDDGHYDEDETGREFYVNPTWGRKIETVEIRACDIRKEMDREDADYDFSKEILFVLDEEGNELWDTALVQLHSETREIYEKKLEDFLNWVDVVEDIDEVIE